MAAATAIMMSKKDTETKNWGDEDEEDLDGNEAVGTGSRIFERVSVNTNQKGQKVRTDLYSIASRKIIH